MLQERIRKAIRAERERQGLSRPQLAQRMKTNYQQVEKLENGERRLTVEWVEKFADALHVDPGILLGGTASTEPTQMSESVANEVARTVAMVARDGDEPDAGTIQVIALMLRELAATFSSFPQAYTDPQVARPVLALASRRFGPAAN